MEIKKKWLYLAAYLYLAIPAVMFLVFWVQPYFSAPIIGLIGYGLFRAHKSYTQTDVIKIDKRLIIALVIIAVWVALSGVGGLMWQNRWDHMFRNAVFNDLVNESWPVINTDGENPRILSYYFGFWLPSAAVAKITGSMALGYAMQFVQAFVGIALTLLLIFDRIGRNSVKAAVIFVFFSGLDVVIYLILHLLRGESVGDFFPLLQSFPHIELVMHPFHAPSTTTSLFWTYNKAVPFWLGFMLLLSRKDREHNGNMLLIFGMTLLYAPQPLLALAPGAVYLVFRNAGLSLRRKEFLQGLRTTFTSLISCSNVGGVLLMLIVVLLYASNDSGKTTITQITMSEVLVFRLMLFMLLEFLLFVLLIRNKSKLDKMFWVMLASQVTINLFLFGGNEEFTNKANAALVFYIMLMVVTHICCHKKWERNLKATALVIVLALGAVTPALEMLRTVQNTAAVISGESEQAFISDYIGSAFNPHPVNVNFIGSDDSLFYRYVMRKPSVS
jgi:hypothetical protein